MQPLPEPPHEPCVQRPSEQMLPEQQSPCVEQVPLVGVHALLPVHTPLVQSSGLTQSLWLPQRTPAGPGEDWQVAAAPADVPRQ